MVHFTLLNHSGKCHIFERELAPQSLKYSGPMPDSKKHDNLFYIAKMKSSSEQFSYSDVVLWPNAIVGQRFLQEIQFSGPGCFRLI